MPTFATVTKTGNSATIVLSSALRRTHGIHIGDRMALTSRPDGTIELEKVDGRGKSPEKIEEGLAFFESMACRPYAGDESSAAKRLDPDEAHCLLCESLS